MTFETCKSIIAMNPNAPGTFSTCAKTRFTIIKVQRDPRGGMPAKFGITAACTAMPRSVW